jgi:hypothetical protein
MTVTEISKEELKSIIGEVIEEKFYKFFDPDYGLELREDFIQKLNQSVVSKERIPFDEVKKKLGLA